MATAVPLHFLIPGLVFAAVVLLSLLWGLRSGKKRIRTGEEVSSSEEIPLAYQIPENYVTMEPAEKRLVTIQNLYLNHGEDPEGIALLLEIDRSFVEEALRRSGHLKTPTENAERRALHSA